MTLLTQLTFSNIIYTVDVIDECSIPDIDANVSYDFPECEH